MNTEPGPGDGFSRNHGAWLPHGLRLGLLGLLLAGAVYSLVNARDLEWRLVQLPPFLLLSLMAVLGIGVGIALDGFFRRFRALRPIKRFVMKYEDFAGHYLGLVGVIYAVVVGFVVVQAWQRYDHVTEISAREVRDAKGLFEILEGYTPLSAVDGTLKNLTLYSEDMQGEWDLMGENKQLCTDIASCVDRTKSYLVSENADEISHAIYALRIPDQRDLSLKDHAATELSDLISVRDERRNDYGGPGLPEPLLIAFCLGAMIIVVTTYLLEVNPVSQRVRTCALWSMIFLMLTLAVVFEHPFTGSERLQATKQWCALYNFENDMARRFPSESCT